MDDNITNYIYSINSNTYKNKIATRSLIYFFFVLLALPIDYKKCECVENAFINGILIAS